MADGIRSLTAQPFSGVVTHHGEGPVWTAEGLIVLDMLAGDVVRLNGSGVEVGRHHIDTVVAAIRQRSGGGFVAGIERGFAFLDRDFAIERTVSAWADPEVRMNDGSADPQGRFWCGGMGYELEPGAAALWRLDSDGSTTQVLTGITCSNGLAWLSPTRAVYIDSTTDRVDSLTFDEAGELSGREMFADLAGLGFPDGLTVDAAGGVWVAIWGGGRLIHLSPEGVLDAEIRVPAAQVTSCAFGGGEFSDLYITTSRYGLDDPEELAGAVFVARPDVGGVAPFTFAG